VLDWDRRADTVYTPQKGIRQPHRPEQLPQANGSNHKDSAGKWRHSTVTVIAENKSGSVAFMVHPRLTRGKGGEDLTQFFGVIIISLCCRERRSPSPQSLIRRTPGRCGAGSGGLERRANSAVGDGDSFATAFSGLITGAMNR